MAALVVALVLVVYVAVAVVEFGIMRLQTQVVLAVAAQ
jgi:hypothetical protein